MNNKAPVSDKERFIKFAIVGFSGTVLDFGVFNLFSNVVGLSTILSSVISFIFGLSNNFFWNRQWTYPESKEISFAEQFGKFAVVSVAGLAIRTTIFSFIEAPLIRFSEAYLNNLPLTPEVIGHNLALATVIIIVLFWNFFANKYWTYKEIKET
jgi:putative flippase GtrA